MDLKDMLFPHDSMREIQADMIKDVDSCIEKSSHLIVHAPTGLGKTASTLPVALSHAIKKNLTIFFLTSRQTQHKIAIDTLKKIKHKHNIDFVTVDMIGKKWMCPVPGTDILYSSEFSDYCRSMREDDRCEFYNNTKEKNKPSIKARKTMDEIKLLNPFHTEELMAMCQADNLCSYEISTMLAHDAKIIVADYYYIFHPNIRETFLARAEKELEDCIIIIDEGHNMPSRIRDLMTERISTATLIAALKEAKKFDYGETIYVIEGIIDILKKVETRSETIMTKQYFIDEVNKIKDYDEVIADLEFIGDDIRGKQKKSFIGSIASFLESWRGPDDGFVRILEKKPFKGKENITLSYRCLDPSIITKPIIQQSHSTILMSGTLNPTSMYRDLLGFPENTSERSYPSPFPKKNKLNLIIPETTTKFTARSELMYRQIAERTASITNLIPGNSIIFFPSYQLRDDIYRHFYPLSKKTAFLESGEMNKQERIELLEKFKEYKKIGAVLLAVSSGSFSEGIDLPDILKCVIVVGLPLKKPNLETEELIRYYDKKFGKGWDYGYLFPAFNKCLQSAGRCIRSETDRGIIVYLDQRFTWPNYFRCFPEDIELKITKDHETAIKNFWPTI